MNQPNGRGSQRVILIAEDDPNDILLLERALQKNGVREGYFIVRDGQEVVDYLSGKGKFADREKYPVPCFLITDLKMPRLGGLEVLRWLKSHPHCAIIPTIILSASQEPSDVKLAYELGVNSYHLKPTSFDQLIEMLGLVLKYWEKSVVPTVPAEC